MKQVVLRFFLLLVPGLIVYSASYAQLSATTSVTNVTCNGLSNGAVNLTVTGGVTPYNYVWSNTATTQNLTGLAAGTYNVTISDSNGPVVGPYTWDYTNTGTNHTILLQTGTITINGNAIANNDWVGVFYTLTGGGLACGGYVQWEGAVNSVSAWADDPMTPAKDGFSSNEAFNWKVWHLTSGSNGVVVTMTATYSSIMPNQGTFSANGLSSIDQMTGTYASSATTTASATVAQPTVISVSGTVTNPSCPASTNGSITTTVSGGTSPYTYLWSTIPVQVTQNASNLIAGTYTLTVTDSHSCTKTSSFTVSAPTAMSLTAVATNVSCYSGTNGAINLSVTGGSTPYIYHWQNNATTQSISGIAAGSFSVTVTDAGNCTASSGYTITQPSVMSISPAVISVNCNGQSNGAVNITVTGGVSGYTYHWSNSALTQNISGLTAGTYSVTVTDANSCTISSTYSVTQPSAISLSTVIANVSCNGGSNGSVTLTVTGGTSPYSYHWQNNATTLNLTNMGAGTTYAVTVTDAHSCTSNGGPYTITQPSALSVSLSNTAVSCNDGSNGTVTSTVAGGTSPYSYLWSNSSTTQNLSALVAAAYNVTVTDSHTCTVSGTTTVSQPAALALSDAVTNVACYSGSTGAINLTVTGGTPAYSYHWSNNSSTQNLTSITANAYSVTVTDSHSCTATVSATVTQPASLSILSLTSNYNGYNISYYGGSDGWINVTVSGGSTPYTYLWSNGATTQNLANVAAGTFTVTVTDSHICTMSSPTIMTQPAQGAPMVVNGTETNVTCNGGLNGAVNVTVSSGTPPYSYIWSTGATTQNISALAAGNYTVTIHDSGISVPGFSWNYTTTSVNHTILLPTGAITLNGSALQSGNYVGVFYLTSTGLACGGYELWSGTATAVSAFEDDPMTPAKDGFNSGETFNWKVWDTNDGCAIDMTATYQTGGSFTSQGTFAANGLSGIATMTGTGTCPPPGPGTATFTAIVTQPNVLTPNGTVTNVACSGGSNGSVALVATGGTSPYSYHWSNGSTAQNLTGVVAGTYSLTLTDVHSCYVTAQFIIGENPSLSLSVVKSDYLGFNISVNGASDGWVNLTVNGGGSPYFFLWSNSQTTQNLSGIPAGNYSVTVTDSYNCTGSTNFTMTQPNPAVPLAATFSVTNVSCYGQSDGALNMTVSGGSTPYTYFWSNGQTTEDISGLPAGTYNVTIIDHSGTYGGPFTWDYTQTGNNATILVLSNSVNLVSTPIQNGDYLGVFYTLPGGTLACGGYEIWTGATTSVSAWGDDPLTPVKDGFSDGEVFTWKLKRAADGYETTLGASYMSVGTPGILNDSTFASNGISGLTNLTANVPPVILPQILIQSVTVAEPALLVVTASNDVSICTGNSTTLTATGNATTYIWSNGYTGASQSVSPSTNSTYIVTGHTNNCTASDTVVVTVNPLPVVNLGPDTLYEVINNSVTLDPGTYTGYLWSTGATTESITVADNSVGTFNYSVVVSDTNNCSNSDAVTIIVTYGIQEIDNTGLINVYPNPGNEYINIIVNNKMANSYRIDILDVNGKPVFTKDLSSTGDYHERLDISGYAKGTYFIKVSFGDSYKVRKLVIE